MWPPKTLRYWRTARHLKPRQVFARLKPAPAPKIDHKAAPPLRELPGPWSRPAARPVSMTGQQSFEFLNEAGTIGKSWELAGKQKLWLYNLHYFDDLNAARAEQREAWHRRLISSWVAHVPAGSGTGWEPYPLSLRLVNWIKWSLSGNALPTEAILSLAVQARWLTRRIEWHILGNHLFSNAKALVFAGFFFSGTEAERWLRAGAKILSHELQEQILGDGGHFERSPMYHSIALEDVLDLINLIRCAGGDPGAHAGGLLADLEAKVAPMMRWLKAMCHPDGQISFFNDATMGIAPAPAELERYAASLGFDVAPVASGLTDLPVSGFVRIAASAAVVIADVGRVGPDYLPAHGHADTLSFEMSIGRRRLIVNSGTSVYGTGAERQRQRGTAAHSTVVVAGTDSSEVWSGFRIGRRARPFAVQHEASDQGLQLQGSHDGYRCLPGRPIHRRSWLLTDCGLTITDVVSGSGHHAIAVYLHLPPWVSADPLDACAVRLTEMETGLALAEVSSDSGLAISIEPGTWHPEFGRSVPNSHLRLDHSGSLPLSHILSIRWIPR